MSFILKALLLWISIFGYCNYFKKYMHPAFAPIVTMSSIGILIFLAGILNVMPIMVYLIVIGGWIFLILSKPWSKEYLESQKDTIWVFVIFSAICALFLVRLYGLIPVHYDSFSHWLTVIREMFNSDSMPNFDSTLIVFQGYPTGSAGFAYFICKFLGNTRDDLVLFAQSILYAASISSFLAFTKKKDIFAGGIIVVGSLFCLVANTNATFTNLLVDTLISLISVAGVAIIIYYREDLIKAAFIALPLQMFLVAIKNSGILMVAINFALIILLAMGMDYIESKKVSFIKLVKLGGLTAGIPAVVYYLWIRHVDYVFASGTTSKHTASIENYAQNLGAKTGEEIKEILTIFVERFVSWNNSWLLLIIIFGILAAGMLCKKLILKKNSKVELFIFAGVLCAYLGFMLILAMMYILSMPYGEAIILAAYARYENTILVYIVGAVTIYCLSLVQQFSSSAKEMGAKVVVLLFMSSILLLQTENLQKLLPKVDTYTGSSRQEFEQIKDKYDIEEEKSYFIYGERLVDDAGYHKYLTRYLFWSTNIELCMPQDLETKKDLIGNYDYLIIIDSDEQIEEFLEMKNMKADEKVFQLKEAS